MGGLVWFDKTIQACQGPTFVIAYERGLVIFDYSHVFRSGGSLMIRCVLHVCDSPEENQEKLSNLTFLVFLWWVTYWYHYIVKFQFQFNLLIKRPKGQ
jgi:hypothetical protein